MKASIKLVISEKESLKGFPVYVSVFHKGQRKKECVGRSFTEHWDMVAQKPKKSHPDYYNFLPVVLDYHARVKKVNFGEVGFLEACGILFSKVAVVSELFFDAGMSLVDGSKTGELYKTVLNRFNGVFPGVCTNEITPKMAQVFMAHLLVTNKPNGVHAYMSKLHAIYNKIANTPVNPFKGVKPRKVKTAQRRMVDADLNKIINTCTLVGIGDYKNTNQTINNYRNYWLLMFYLGGINFIDLAKMRYDEHVFDGRINFNRNKGGTNVFINNLIVPQARSILENFDCYPYLVPIYNSKNLDSFRNNMNRRLSERLIDLDLTNKPTTYSARYTFINRSRQLMIDERVCIEIVGHEQQKTHSIYTDEYPLTVRDEAHLKIVTL